MEQVQKSDWCTMFPEGWWSECCRLHDLAYEGTKERLQADFDLMCCVASSWEGSLLLGASSALIGGVMFVGVRLFGGRFYKK